MKIRNVVKTRLIYITVLLCYFRLTWRVEVFNLMLFNFRWNNQNNFRVDADNMGWNNFNYLIWNKCCFSNKVLCSATKFFLEIFNTFPNLEPASKCLYYISELKMILQLKIFEHITHEKLVISVILKLVHDWC